MLTAGQSGTGARVWIGETDADAAPYATDLTGVESVTVISPGAVSIPAPGHTQGHVLYHVDDRVLFTGDTLHWNHRRGEFDVFPKQTFFSWAALADTMDLIAALKVEWMFAGHGMWHEVSAEEWERQMPVLGQAMRRRWSTSLVPAHRHHLWLVLNLAPKRRDQGAAIPVDPPVHVTLHVTQDCIDQATLTPTNCPVARAATAAGAGPAEVVTVFS